MSKTKTPSAAQIAKLRKGGAKWNEVRAKLGVSWTDTKLRTVLRAAGYAPNGIKGGDGLEIAKRPAQTGAVATKVAKDSA